MNMKKQLGDYILSAIEMANLTQKEAATLLNVTPQSLNNYIHNYRIPDVDTLCHILRFFHLDANQVLNIRQDYASQMLASPEEARLLREYRQLDQEHKEFAEFILTKMPKEK